MSQPFYMHPYLAAALVLGVTATTCFVYYLYIQASLEKDDNHD